MPYKSERKDLIDSILLSMAVREVFNPPVSWEDYTSNLEKDSQLLLLLENTRYLNDRPHVPKAGNLHLVWEYAQDPAHHHRFVNLLQVSPLVFLTLLELIQDHPIFTNSSHHPQEPVEVQLSVMLYRMGRFGNAASIEDTARAAGCSEGSVENYTIRCMKAVLSLHERFVRKLSAEEKEVEKLWMDNFLGFKGAWRDGWVMYDGTIVVLQRKPGLNGDAYFTRTSNYGLNVQIGNVPSNLRIVDYSHGMTGSAHDAAAFEHTAAAKHTAWFFEGEEFAWADSAYTVNAHTIPVHRKPAALNPRNALFDKVVSSFRVRSEHCMGALKGRFQCLRGLRASINSVQEHHDACQWITAAIILHNAVIDIEGKDAANYFTYMHSPTDEEEDTGFVENDEEDRDRMDTNWKRSLLVDELWRVRTE